MSTRVYKVDEADIRRAFPPSLEPPGLLMEFGQWLAGRPWGSVGCFDLAGSWADDAPIVDGTPLRREFALFLHLPDGSEAGFWLPPGHDPNAPSIVGLGSEGEAGVIAPSLEAFLARLAVGAFDDGGTWSDFAPSELVVEDGLDDLAEWLRGRLGRADLEAVAVPGDSIVFATRMARRSEEREAYWGRHPALADLAHLLNAHRPKGRNPWDSTRFEVSLVGDLFQARVFERGPQPIPEAALMEPILRALRDAQALSEPGCGLWFTMHFDMHADGTILPRFDYQTRPVIDGAPAPVDQGRADLARAPRPERWVPAWLSDPDAA
ncbi:hypothetical protein ASF27_11340 [Methylobacterium sp. Leaf102]|uniref:hypothetical protein n=1 Tax=Methylobacterium sp. Leaf102 TaxID=1736253 RepID=UPI0006FB2F55|nr:hypothetical protein [Methylobacterium sp. Leaf102]KQP24670.1 hypothetical protein ASF27_11340 [Methylobacterium sp. Leaf102]